MVEESGIQAVVTKPVQDTSSIFYILYILYKSNTLTRLHLRQIVKIIKDKHPENISEFILKEAARD